MCGLAGFASLQRHPEQTEECVHRMLGTLTRRGPDSAGYFSWPGVGFGHRRLAILDLSAAGHQPMLNEEGSVGVVFNGCIYNFLDLRAELEREGQRFRSHCDTEILVRGYQAWGLDKMVRRLRGMFAFAIWDEPRRTLSLVRDRLGVKPLVYAAPPGEIAFASTVGALRAAGFGGALTPTAVLEFLEYGAVAGDTSFHDGIHKLPPAAILEWKDGKVSQRSYWKLPEIDEASKITFDEAVEHTERLIIEATRLRLIADVPVSALLSGGVDSTLVCWALSKLNANLTAFTVGSGGDASDETAQARDTAQRLGIPHEVVELPADRPEALGEMAEAFSEPFASQSAQALMRVSRAIRPKATVLLTGDGGDEAYLGYPFFDHAWRAQSAARSLPRPLAPLLRAGAACLPPVGPFRRMRSFASYTTGGLGPFLRLHNNTGALRREGLFGERLRGSSLMKDVEPASFDSARNLLRDVVTFQNRVYFVGEFLQKVDGATMFHSLEARAPFLDQELWEFAAALPPALRLRGHVLKAILREIVSRRLDPSIAQRPKQGFTVPVETWLASRWGSSLEVLLQNTQLEREGWIAPGTLAPFVSTARQRGQVPTTIWYLLVLEHWLQNQNRASS
jgi:asparagine synthase (glutamine-hydrolysing)